ncbi:MAG: DUF3108 domain-containing protein [Gemmatimonadales bacterium]|nr:MAG: DUF3108 domain-containing protein [Gemmatimonadales bacterium]
MQGPPLSTSLSMSIPMPSCPGCRSTGAAVFAGLLFLWAAVHPPTAEGQQTPPTMESGLIGPLENSAAAAPFGPGERLEYQVRLGRLRVGEGSLSVEGVERIRGESSYHVSLRIAGGIPLARVDDHYQSWFDIVGLSSRRFIQDTRQIRRQRYRHFEIIEEEGRWDRLDHRAEGDLPTEAPLDEIAFLYYIRTMDLEVGETYELNRYFRADRNPVILHVLRRETIEVPAGTFETIVVRPIIKAGGLFGEGGEAEVYISDDEDRILVRVESRVPVIGSLSMRLKDIRMGQPLARSGS